MRESKWTDFCGAGRMSVLYLLQAAGPPEQRPLLEQFLEEQRAVFGAEQTPDFPFNDPIQAGELRFFWRAGSRALLFDSLALNPDAALLMPPTAAASLYKNKDAAVARNAATSAVQLPLTGRLYSLCEAPDDQWLLREYHYAISPKASQAELLAFLPLGLMKGAWVWGEG